MLPSCWAIPPEDGKTREQLLTVKTFPSEGGKQGGGGGGGGEERREEEEGGKRGECRVVGGLEEKEEVEV